MAEEIRDKFRIKELSDGELYQEEKAISIEHRDNKVIFHNKDHKIALEMVDDMIENLVECISRIINLESVEYDDLDEVVIELTEEADDCIIAMNKQINKMKIAVYDKYYLSDTSILPMLTIEGRGLIDEAIKKELI